MEEGAFDARGLGSRVGLWRVSVPQAHDALLVAHAAPAQAWPNRPIRIVVPDTPGGYTDLMARLVGQKISDALGQPVIFENKLGRSYEIDLGENGSGIFLICGLDTISENQK
jgi:hypothetical protein